jgi:hypothetical protein
VLGILAVDAVLAGLEVKDGYDANSDLSEENGFEDSAQDLFQQLQEQDRIENESAP